METRKILDHRKTGTGASKLLSELQSRIVGQPEPLKLIVEAWQQYQAGMSNGTRPLGNFLFLGPTGTGKTRTVEALAESLLGSTNAVLKIDCAEFQHSHEVAKIIGCFKPGSQVTMEDGSTKSIEDIAIGETVVAGNGKIQSVLDTHQYEHSGEMIELSIANTDVPIVCTPDHKILAIRGAAKDGGRVRNPKLQYDPSNLEWIEAKDLCKNDIVVQPRYTPNLECPPTIDVVKFLQLQDSEKHEITSTYIKPLHQANGGTKVKRHIDLDENFYRLAGYYVAEGGGNRYAFNEPERGISFTLGVPQKQEAIDDIKRLVPLVFGEYCQCCEDFSRNAAVRLYLHSLVIGPLMCKLFGTRTLEKQLPTFFKDAPESFLWHFVDAAIMGDGCRTFKRRVDYSTSSDRLHQQLNFILRARLGVITQLQKHESNVDGWSTRYRTYIAGAQIAWFASKLPLAGKGIDLTGQRYAEGIQRGAHMDAQYLYFRIAAAKPIVYKGVVYDLSVSEDPDKQSYLVESIVVRNSPPGYLGHRETQALLSQKNLDRYHTDKIKISLVLFDEIEKASDALWNMMLSIMDKGTLTMGDNNKVDFTRAFIFMTGNLGAKAMADSTRDGMGFSVPKAAVGDAAIKDKLTKIGLEAARKRFTPEFYNRLDRVVVFNPLGMVELETILGLELKAVQKRIFYTPADMVSNTVPFVFSITHLAKQVILKSGYDIRFGARHIKRAVEKQVVQPLANLIMSGEIRDGDLVSIDVRPSDDELMFVRLKEGLNMMDMAKHCGELYLKDENLPSTVDGGNATSLPVYTDSTVTKYSDILGAESPAPPIKKRGTKVGKKDLVVRRI